MGFSPASMVTVPPAAILERAETTLVRIACRQLHPDAGSHVPRLMSCYCAQDATVQPDNLEEFALAFDGLAVALRRDLGIEEDWAWAFGELSGGQQKRLQVACALWAQPDVLTVDEPTNHVDATTRPAIATALSRFAGVGLLVAHDRELLDVLCSQCLFVTRVGAAMRPGGYTHASSQAALERRSAAHARAEDRLAGARVEKRYEGGIRAEARPSRRPVLLDTEPTTPRRGAFALSVPALHIGSNGRIGLVGDNGTGKSTLVSHDLAICGRAQRFSGGQSPPAAVIGS